MLSNTTPLLTDDLIDFDAVDQAYIGAEEFSSTVRQEWDGDIGFVYFTTDFIDFSDESNRLLFADALGYPVPLLKSIDDGLIPEGLIRMGFEDSADLGFNSGTGGDFTINGTITQGADVNG